jgi:hypothetical protein
MKISKLTVTKSKLSSKLTSKGEASKTNGSIKAFKHQFQVLSADDIYNNRAKAYEFLVY